MNLIELASASPAGQVFGLSLFAVIGIGLLAFVVLFVAALISILRSPLSTGMKVIWVLIAFVAPFLGSLLWFALGRREAQRG